MRRQMDEFLKGILILGAIFCATILIGLYIEKSTTKMYRFKTILIQKDKIMTNQIKEKIMKKKKKIKKLKVADCIICFGKDKKCTACNGSGRYFPAPTSKYIQDMIINRIDDMTHKKNLTISDMKKELNILVKVLLYMEKHNTTQLKDKTNITPNEG